MDFLNIATTKRIRIADVSLENVDRKLNTPKKQRQGQSGQQRSLELFGILLLFVLSFAAITTLSHIFGLVVLTGDSFINDARWGSVSDWFSGVVGVSIGLAGSAIAIWLAYRVEKLTVAQNELANAQAWRETYINSGDIKNRAQLACRAYGYVEEIYSSLLQMKSLDNKYSLEIEQQEEEERTFGKARYERFGDHYTPEMDDVSDQCNEITERYHRAIKTHQDSLFEAVKNLVNMIPIIRPKGDDVQNSLGIKPAELKMLAASYIKDREEAEGTRNYRVADRIINQHQIKVYEADAIYFFMSGNVAERVAMGNAYYRVEDEHPAEFAEFFWETNSTSVGNALEKVSDYLPQAIIHTDRETYYISWIAALCDYVINEVNPYRYAQYIIKDDLIDSEFDERQKERFMAKMDSIIAEALPSVHYIREIFSDTGFGDRSEVVVTKTTH